MEKRKLSGKTILKLAGALLALVYLGFCIYAGITGKFSGMHREEHVLRFGDLKNWVSGAMSAVMITFLCIYSAINDLKIQKEHRKSSAPFFLLMLLLSFPLLLESYLDIGWIGIAIYAGIAAFFFGIACIPQLLNQWITRLLLCGKPMSGKTTGADHRLDSFSSAEKVTGFWAVGLWCCAGSARLLGNCNREN